MFYCHKQLEKLEKNVLSEEDKKRIWKDFRVFQDKNERDKEKYVKSILKGKTRTSLVRYVMGFYLPCLYATLWVTLLTAFLLLSSDSTSFKVAMAVGIFCLMIGIASSIAEYLHISKKR